MKMKKILSILMVICMLIPVISANASAASNVLTFRTLDEIPENLEIFKTIRDGSIDAVNVGGNWYYQFTRSGQKTVRIHVRAFQTQPANGNLDKDNAAINANLQKELKHNWERVCYYNTVHSRQMQLGGERFLTYRTNMYRLLLTVGCKDDVFLTKCELTHGVSFSYSTKVISSSKVSGGYSLYVTPSNAEQYRKALTRSKSVLEITPEIAVSVTNTGKNDSNLSEYYVSGVGNVVSTEENARKLLDFAYKTSKFGTMVFNPVSTIEEAAEAMFELALGEIMPKMTKQSGIYNTGEAEPLSKNGGYVYCAEYTSPVKLTNYADWVQVKTWFNQKMDGGMMNVKFSFS